MNGYPGNRDWFRLNGELESKEVTNLRQEANLQYWRVESKLCPPPLGNLEPFPFVCGSGLIHLTEVVFWVIRSVASHQKMAY